MKLGAPDGELGTFRAMHDSENKTLFRCNWYIFMVYSMFSGKEITLSSTKVKALT